ncbi:MAG: carboxypeptidase-like regulatory domain-containing protein [Candidatus Zixiibacteriota bacterium]
MRNRLLFWVVLLTSASAAFAGFNGTPADMNIYVTSCQGIPYDGARAVLVGEAVAEDLGDGSYRLDGVYPGPHRLLVYDTMGEVYDSPFTTNAAVSRVDMEVIICLCIETQCTPVKGRVENDAGKAASGARVAVEDLFLETTADKKGRYELVLPPGEWEIHATGRGLDVAKTIMLPVPPEPGDDVEPVELNLP